MDFKQFENKHKGQRCFVLGNAPNLIKEDLSLLKDERVFITNRGYMAKTHGLDHFDYHVVVDMAFYDDYSDEISKVEEGVKFYPEVMPEYESYKGEKFVPVYTLPTVRQVSGEKWQLMDSKRFPKTYWDGWGKAGNAVMNASLIAYFMGFTEIYLLGVEMIYRKGDTHFYKDVSHREQQVKDGHRSKGPKFIPVFVEFFNSKDVKFVNLTRTFPYKDLMPTDTLENVLGNK